MMQKSDSNRAVRAHRKVGSSTTLNRKYVRRPKQGTDALEASVKEAAQAEAFEEARAQRKVQKAAQTEASTKQVKRSPKISRFNDEPIKQNISIEEAIETEAKDNLAKEATAKKRTIKIKDETDRQQEQVLAQAEAEIQQRANARRQTTLEREVQMAEQLQEGNALAPVEPAMTHPLQAAAMERMRQQSESKKTQKISAKEIKDREIKKALARTSRSIDKDIAKRQREKKRAKMHFSIARVMLAVSCAAAAIMAIVYFVGTNMPDISMRVAAMQTGIRASYPSFVPRGFTMTDLSSEAGKVTMNFSSDENGDAFTLVEENSSWDSSALETNYVKKEFGDKYSIVREQGLTIYMIDYEGAAWVNGGVVYKIIFQSGDLTKKQIQSIATSL